MVLGRIDQMSRPSLRLHISCHRIPNPVGRTSGFPLGLHVRKAASSKTHHRRDRYLPVCVGS